MPQLSEELLLQIINNDDANDNRTRDNNNVQHIGGKWLIVFNGGHRFAFILQNGDPLSMIQFLLHPDFLLS